MNFSLGYIIIYIYKVILVVSGIVRILNKEFGVKDDVLNYNIKLFFRVMFLGLFVKYLKS